MVQAAMELGVTRKISMQLLRFYHGHLDPFSESEIPKQFKDPKCPFRCLISTIAFGLGMQVGDIKYVLHWVRPGLRSGNR